MGTCLSWQAVWLASAAAPTPDNIVTTIRILVILLAACAPQAVGRSTNGPLDQDVVPPTWRHTAAERYTVYAHAGFEHDVDRISRLLDNSIAALTDEFASFGGVRLLDEVDLSIVLYPNDNDRVTTGRSLSETIGSTVQLSFLTPSKYDAGALNSAGQPFDDNAWQHQITHELVTTFAQRATLSKSAGWVYFQAPNWFMQGYEEYLGHVLSPGAGVRVDSLRAQLAARELRLSVSEDGEILSSDPYLQGLFMVRWLHEEYGRDFASKIFRNESATFWEAMKSEFHATPVQIITKWRELTSPN